MRLLDILCNQGFMIVLTGMNKEKVKPMFQGKQLPCTSNKLEVPDYSEGFNGLYFVSISEDGYKIDEWRQE